MHAHILLGEVAIKQPFSAIYCCIQFLFRMPNFFTVSILFSPFLLLKLIDYFTAKTLSFVISSPVARTAELTIILFFCLMAWTKSQLCVLFLGNFDSNNNNNKNNNNNNNNNNINPKVNRAVITLQSLIRRRNSNHKVHFLRHTLASFSADQKYSIEFPSLQLKMLSPISGFSNPVFHVTWKSLNKDVVNVKTQWFRISNTNNDTKRIKIHDNSLWYSPVVDDFGCQIEVELTPIFQTGFIGNIVKLSQSFAVSPELEESLNDKKKKFNFSVLVKACHKKEEIFNQTNFTITSSSFRIGTETTPMLSSSYHTNFSLKLSKQKAFAFHIDGLSSSRITIIANSPTERDVIVFLLRSFLKLSN